MIKKIVKYIYLKIKWRKKVKFRFSDSIGLKSIFEGMNQLHPHVVFNGYLGYGSYIGPFSKIDGKIGKFSSIGPCVRCNQGHHPYTYPYVSTAPCFFSLNPAFAQNGSTFATRQCYNELSFADDEKKYGVEIGNDCWIGEGVFLVGGIKISDGAVILAHAVVTKNVPPYAVVGGVPAKVLKYRYAPEDIEFLLKIQWWNRTEDWFRKNWLLLTDFDKLKEYYDHQRFSKKSI